MLIFTYNGFIYKITLNYWITMKYFSYHIYLYLYLLIIN